LAVLFGQAIGGVESADLGFATANLSRDSVMVCDDYRVLAGTDFDITSTSGTRRLSQTKFSYDATEFVTATVSV
jgi:hypothetical protein